MKKNKDLSGNPDVDLKRCIFLGSGRSGSVYLMPDGRAIKIFKDQESCVHEYMILESVKGNRHFPEAYECRNNFIIRDFVDGICLVDYVKKYGLSKTLSLNLIELIEDFKRLGFTKLDMRCSHIFIQDDESVMVIDPRGNYTVDMPYPKSIMKKLKKLDRVHEFISTLRSHYPSLYAKWKKRIV